LAGHRKVSGFFFAALESFVEILLGRRGREDPQSSQKKIWFAER